MPRKPAGEPDGSAGEFAESRDVPAGDRDGELATIGKTVRSTRRLMGMTVEALASRAGVSTGALSQLERGQGNPSLQTMQRLATALSIPLVQLLQGAAEREHHVVRAGHGPRLPAPSDDTRDSQVLRELLTPSGGRLQVIRSEVPPGFSNEGHSYRHLGQECVVVLSGRLRVSIGQEVVDLSQGDTITYDCTAAHWWANPGTETTVVLGAVTPLAF
ncbi:helix-turn-helix domain-containing protein [Streptomyces marispadix]|uniref:XRE family transcriptional regulator n=1 Tax=Streptomyces marispadix TaxID=2922868 RepID=A0ABS9T5R0_9ACTN|nr:XRE family transcriptional regulator [Streptomyces marispadix]MCH6163862.1 XRE family transcriptional regulator [Streptomyces marispadix]